MSSNAIQDNGGDRSIHPAMKNILVFIVGALFGAVFIFFFVTLHAPLPQIFICPQTAVATMPQANTAAVGTATTPTHPNVVVPPIAAQPATPTTIPQHAPAQPLTTTTPTDPPAAVPTPTSTPTDRLASALLIPVVGIKASQLTDTYTAARSGGRVHDAIDIMAPRGSHVVAADDGMVAKLFYSKQGGLTVYQFDPTEKFVYYYAHLDSYAPGLVEGKPLHRGDPIGLVGFSGNANPTAPHLHFAISVLGSEKHWWQATAINPYPLLGGR